MSDLKESVSNGLYAFPFSDEKYFCPGMTLRDYFAAKAMQGLLQHTAESIHQLASESYDIADTMLKARKQA